MEGVIEATLGEVLVVVDAYDFKVKWCDMHASPGRTVVTLAIAVKVTRSQLTLLDTAGLGTVEHAGIAFEGRGVHAFVIFGAIGLNPQPALVERRGGSVAAPPSYCCIIYCREQQGGHRSDGKESYRAIGRDDSGPVGPERHFT